MATNCRKNALVGATDMLYIERRLEVIEARIDDLVGLLGELLERIDKGESLR